MGDAMAKNQDSNAKEDEKEARRKLPVSLLGEINTATAALHTALNRLITSHLPLALPPYTDDASIYASGLLHFAHIFLTFESLWADLLRDYTFSATQSMPPHFTSHPSLRSGSASPPISPLLSYLLVNPYDSPSLFTSTLGAPTPPSPQLAAFLQTLRPRGMVRSSRLKKDLEYLLGLHPTDLEVLLAKYPGDKVADFCTHIRKSVNEKPWTLVSYAWCFYMAIFSGGRWIRRGLLNAPADFWPATDDDNKTSLEDRGLSVWHFPGRYDGEDIKAEFKLRLAAAEQIFSPDERVDIIEEAKTIFNLCSTLVDELDEIIGTSMFTTEVSSQMEKSQDLPATEKKTARPEKNSRTAHVRKSGDPIMTLLRRPEVTGTLVALGCLACVALLRVQ